MRLITVFLILFSLSSAHADDDPETIRPETLRKGLVFEVADNVNRLMETVYSCEDAIENSDNKSRGFPDLENLKNNMEFTYILLGSSRKEAKGWADHAFKQLKESNLPKRSNADQCEIDIVKAQDALSASTQKYLTGTMVVTTADTVAGHEIDEVIGLVASEAVAAIVSTQNDNEAGHALTSSYNNDLQNTLKQARQDCMEQLKLKAHNLGANALIAVDLDYSESSKGIAFVTATGTAVKLSAIDNDIEDPQPKDNPPVTLLTSEPIKLSHPPTTIDNSPLQTFTGHATVIDGDTIDIGEIRFRLDGIDAPESWQMCTGIANNQYDCGRMMAVRLNSYLEYSQPVTCKTSGKDRYKRYYKRYVAVCFRADGQNINEWSVASGNAVAWPNDSHGTYAADQEIAKSSNQGLWQGPFDLPCETRAKKFKHKSAC